MGRQSLRSPFPISARSSSIQAETNYDQRSISRMRSQESMMADRNRKAHRLLGDYNANPRYTDREGSIAGTVDSSMDDRYSMASSTVDRESIYSSATQHELRVRASSPLLGRNYHTSKNQQVPELPQIPQSGSGSWSEMMMSKPDPYAFETQSQHSLAYGVVEDMKGIRFPNLASDPPQQPQQQRQQLQISEPAKETKKKRPSRIDLSMLFPKPKPIAEPLLSPQRLTSSPSPVPSEASVARRATPAKLTKPRSRNNSIKKVDDVIPEESAPPMPNQSRKTVDWFDIPVEKTIRVDNVAADYAADDEELSPTMVYRPTPEIRQPQPQKAPSQKEINFSQPMSIRSTRKSSIASRVSRRTSRSNESHVSPPPTTPSSDKIRTSLQPWQSEGDLRSKRSHGRLSKKSSSSTLTAYDLSKTSVLSLSSSEDEDESEDAREDDAKYGESLVKGASLPRMLRASISTYDGFEPEICTAEAVVTTRGHPLTQFNPTAPLSRSYSKMSTDSSDSRRTVRRASGRNRDPSLASVSRSASNRRLESRASTRVSLIEEHEELADVHEENEDSNPSPLPVPASSNNTSQSGGKRRSRIIAVTRQEESLLEAMRQRNGRFTPSIFHEVTSATNTDSDTDSNRRPSPNPRVQETTPQPSYDTSFLRLSTAMFPSPGSPLPSPGVEGAVSKEKEAFMSPSSTSDSEQRTTESNSTASPRLSLAYSTHSSSSTTGHTSPMTPTLPIHRFSPRAPPPTYAPPPIPEAARRHSRRRTDSSEAIIVDDSANGKEGETEYPIWAIKWARDSVDLAVAH